MSECSGFLGRAWVWLQPPHATLSDEDVANVVIAN